MAQQSSDGAGAGKGHGERLASVDATFLEMETPQVHMHVGGLLIFDPPPPPPDAAEASRFASFLALIGGRLHQVPRYRQKLAYPPLGIGNPVWVDDPDFDLSFHVRHAALPAPGTMAHLTEYSARILSRPLDRDRPLWEIYVIEGLEEGRLAILSKSHHALIDGLDGVEITTVMLDLEPTAPEDVAGPQPWSPASPPGSAELAVGAVRDLATSPRELVRTVRRMVDAPAKTALQALGVGRGVLSVARTNLTKPAPRSLLNCPPGQHRRLAVQRVPLDEVKAIKDAFGTTVNDVVLAAVSDATGRYLRSQGTRTDGLWLRVMVPVSTRDASGSHALGNRVVSVLVDLPMFEMDAVERLRVCHDAMADVRSSHQAVGAEFLTGLAQFAPPTIHAMASRAASGSRLFNFAVTNVPGPQQSIYCLGARLLGFFPFSPLAATQSYAVGLTSIDGWLNFGFIGGYDAVPDLDQVTGFLVDAVAELRRSADAVHVRGDLARQRTATGEGAGGVSGPRPAARG
ncbi:MAG: wax ester/triacylglycerol synthase family O-acyltransferase [Nitriliruptor sp.]|uniref:wax ester/triacylglycerol synthase family O-acyltransferase n=1 Tax=Nitriliruptor sp. TaxID=2448056 RepID=UPI0034A03BDB